MLRALNLISAIEEPPFKILYLIIQISLPEEFVGHNRLGFLVLERSLQPKNRTVRLLLILGCGGGG